MKNKWIWIVVGMCSFGFVARECARVKPKQEEIVIDAYKATPATIREAMKRSKKNGITNISEYK